jgi:hypothetical protein
MPYLVILVNEFMNISRGFIHSIRLGIITILEYNILSGKKWDKSIFIKNAYPNKRSLF